MTYPTPTNVGFYAVARHNGRTILADGPHSAPVAHLRVDEAIRPALRKRPFGSFADVGVTRVVTPPGTALPIRSVATGT